MKRTHDDESSPFMPIATGVEMRILRRSGGGGPDEAHGMTFLMRMARGARAPLHDHPGGEETYVLEGALRFENRTDAGGTRLDDIALVAGDYACVDAGETHDGIATERCLFLVVARGGVRKRD